MLNLSSLPGLANLPQIDLSKIPSPSQLEAFAMNIEAVLAPFAALPPPAGTIITGIEGFGQVAKVLLDAEMTIQQVQNTVQQSAPPGSAPINMDPLRQIIWQFAGGLLHQAGAQSSTTVGTGH